MDLNYIPEENDEYSTVEYWNKRYETEDSYEWFKSYDDFKGIIKSYLKPDDHVLLLGCGNSRLSEDMFKDGFQHIVNIDYSSVVIEKMKNHCGVCCQMQWEVMDMRKLEFASETFDVVIEKGTLDSMMTTEKNPWNLSRLCTDTMDNILKQISRVLKSDGHFISISFAQPHFRRKLYAKSEYGWDFSFETFGTMFHYYVYVMGKGKPLQAVQTETVRGTSADEVQRNTKTTCEEDADFLRNIQPD